MVGSAGSGAVVPRALLVAALLLGLLLSLPGPPSAGPARAGVVLAGGSTGVAPPAAPDELGPFTAGYRTLTVSDPGRPGRLLTTSVWYPGAPARLGPVALPPAALPPAAQYPAARYPVAPGVDVPSALAHEEIPVAPGRFPLVVVSHGSAGGRVQLAYLAEALATHGFVVAAPDHPGDTMIEAAEGRQAPLVELASDRLLDVSAVISAFTKPDCPLSRMVRADEVGVVGFSFGGLTSVVSTVGFLRAPADPRVRAVVGIAPATEVVPERELDRVRVPVLLVGGSDDLAAPVERNAGRTFDGLHGAHPRYLVTVTGGMHNSFTEICAQAAAVRDRPVPEGVRVRLEVTAEVTCRPPAVDIDRAHRLTTYYTVAFLERRLLGATTYDSFLTPAAARRFPEALFHAAG
ncbi:dienelactone hydrolase family protein [Frankia sp. Mgl5]|uniref:alpha/beta hydrolase family protein n=1 Tax=Frankia sp. Mgl5 TaxID=2933793 RepID=UPI00200D0839|nr:dienelactone hydrolase family protein [Frankia sp. Mgl5]MCK9931529.1 dienelactone hydrolase family protein [Frankia sp. Mgl5]